VRSAVDIQAGVSESFASVLRSGRPEFNSRFAEARRAYPDLDGAAFLEFLRTTLDPLIGEIAKIRPESVAEVVIAGYEAGLELVGQKLVGSAARHHLVEEGWRRVLPVIAPLVATAPARTIGAVSNALHHLADTSGARPLEWINQLSRLGPKCADVDTLLRLGQVAAWRTGLAHFRKGAIETADGLPASLALAVVGASNSNDWSPIRKRLWADPWFDPAAQDSAGKGSTNHAQVVARAGAFRGFGGVFTQPPRVVASNEHFLVRSGQESWLLTADLFGATFHRTNPQEFDSAAQQTKTPPDLRTAASRLVWRNEPLDIPDLGKITSAAANSTTLALTGELTHAIVLVALR
jgi:hypothetical protein